MRVGVVVLLGVLRLLEPKPLPLDLLPLTEGDLVGVVTEGDRFAVPEVRNTGRFLTAGGGLL